jgi:hypothetical protein
MISREFVILAGIALAAWGHLLLHEKWGAPTVWARIDGLFPPAWRTAPSLAGGSLLGLGALFVLTPVLA